MKSSIALCTYNGAKFLAGQLESFLRQTRLPDELVVCDDRSTDETIGILEDFARDAPFPVRIYVNENNLGSTKNFERAISFCTGDLIFLSDQDDVWENKKISRMVSIFDQNPDTILAFSDAEIVDENLKSLGKSLWETTFNDRKRNLVSKENFFGILLNEGIVTGATVCFKSELKDYILPIPILGNFIHDGWIALVAAQLGKVEFLSEKLIKYRQHSNQQIGASVIKRNKMFSEIMATHKKDLKEITGLSAHLAVRN